MAAFRTMTSRFRKGVSENRLGNRRKKEGQQCRGGARTEGSAHAPAATLELQITLDLVAWGHGRDSPWFLIAP